MDISVVVPLFNEAESLPELLSWINRVMAEHGFSHEVILVDDVLWTGRTIRAALDALLDFGRPQKVELCVLIDRRFNRELPIQPDYTGRAIDTIVSQKVKVFWKENGTKECVELE